MDTPLSIKTAEASSINKKYSIEHKRIFHLIILGINVPLTIHQGQSVVFSSLHLFYLLWFFKKDFLLYF